MAKSPRHAVTIPATSGDADLVLGGHRVRLTNLAKPFWSSRGAVITKRDLLQYYADVAPWLLPHLRQRAMVMKRYPIGATGKCFFMKRVPDPSRWSTERSSQWEPLAPKLVVEVRYDHFSGGRFRHGTSFLRWRPDKPPARCTMQQVEQEGRSALALLR